MKVTEKKNRQPVVTVMGHVDHGKTTLLDLIQGTKVAEKEIGGITQNTRACEVTLQTGKKITFIDTPGHEAFANMRQRGAQVTDIVLLVVAADDGIQPQTKQSIEFAQNHNVPIIVAINKIDIPGANIQKIKHQLSSFGVVIEEFGGDVMCFEISAKENIGVDNLLSGIEVLSEFLNLKERELLPGTQGYAYVLESILDKKIGHLSLCILQAGTVKAGSFARQFNETFKIRCILDHDLITTQQIDISKPIYLLGQKNALKAGEIVYFCDSEDKAKSLENIIQNKNENINEITKSKENLSPKDVLAQILKQKELEEKGLSTKRLNIIIKTSTKGTLEAIENKIKELSTQDAEINMLYTAVGNVTEDDIKRAKLSKSIILTFQLQTPSKILSIAKSEKVLVRNYEIIYEMFDEILEVLESMGKPTEEEIDTAFANIKQIFTLSNGSIVYGCEVLQGTIVKGNKIKIISKDGIEKGRGKITSLRIIKNEVKEVKKGLDCGIQLDQNINGVFEGDKIVCYTIQTY